MKYLENLTNFDELVVKLIVTVFDVGHLAEIRVVSEIVSETSGDFKVKVAVVHKNRIFLRIPRISFFQFVVYVKICNKFTWCFEN